MVDLKTFLGLTGQPHLGIVLWDHNDNRIGGFKVKDLTDCDKLMSCEVIEFKTYTRPRYLDVTIRT